MSDDESPVPQPMEANVQRRPLVPRGTQCKTSGKLEDLGEVEEDLPHFDDRVEAIGYCGDLVTGPPICGYGAQTRIVQ